MQKRVRGILIDKRMIILIKRVKKDETYYVFPGGGVENGETLREAVKREIKEELGLDVTVGKLLIEKHFDKSGIDKIEYFYFCKIVGGTLGTGDGPEYKSENVYEGTHEPIRLSIRDIRDLNLLPLDVKNLVWQNYE